MDTDQIPNPKTFTEYLNWWDLIKDIQLEEMHRIGKNPPFSVTVNKEDCHYIANEAKGGLRIGLNIQGTIYEYITRPTEFNTKGLWVYNDNTGQYQKSVFVMNEL